MTEIENDTKPNYEIDNLKERYNEALLNKSEFTTKKNDSVMKKIKFDIV